MISAHRRVQGLVLSAGMLGMLLLLGLTGRVSGHGPACGAGLDAPGPVYTAYHSRTYGWGRPALRIERIACQPPPGPWAPQTIVTWDAGGVLLALLQLLLAGLLAQRLLGGRLRRP